MQRISERVIGCAITVSNQLGAGFLESVYANALAIELRESGIDFEREKQLTVFYKQQQIGAYFADFVVENRLAVELKALSRLTSEHEAQVMNYLRASSLQVGLLLNFGTPKLGIQRIVSGYDEGAPI
jgi:GxxExxY protein